MRNPFPIVCSDENPGVTPALHFALFLRGGNRWESSFLQLLQATGNRACGLGLQKNGTHDIMGLWRVILVNCPRDLLPRVADLRGTWQVASEAHYLCILFPVLCRKSKSERNREELLSVISTVINPEFVYLMNISLMAGSMLDTQGVFL